MTGHARRTPSDWSMISSPSRTSERGLGCWRSGPEQASSACRWQSVGRFWWQSCIDLASPEFAHVAHRRYICAREYSAATYCELLGSFSNVLALEERLRTGLLACMSSLIDSQFGGRIVRHDLYDLCVARRARYCTGVAGGNHEDLYFDYSGVAPDAIIKYCDFWTDCCDGFTSKWHMEQ